VENSNNPRQSSSQQTGGKRWNMFDYDDRAPLDVHEAGSERRGRAVVHDLSYARSLIS
jgi:hypothetical protein